MERAKVNHQFQSTHAQNIAIVEARECVTVIGCVTTGYTGRGNHDDSKKNNFMVRNSWWSRHQEREVNANLMSLSEISIKRC